jgi:hypothetical protein
MYVESFCYVLPDILHVHVFITEILTLSVD